MATPTFKTLPQIIQEMIDYIEANSELTDVNIGSVIRTIVEASGIQDAEQFVQLIRVLDAFSIDTVEGDDLDKRADDFGLFRLNAAQSTGFITVTDTTVSAEHKATAFATYAPGTIVFQVNESITAFPTTGTLIFERDITGQKEYVAHTSKNNGLKQFTLAGDSTTKIGRAHV